jgi:hypothetical protein
MEIKSMIGLSRGEFMLSTVSRETCEDCGKFTRVFVKYTPAHIVSYGCANPNCKEDSHANIANHLQHPTSQS